MSQPVSTHVNPPWKSFVLFLLVGALGWAGYEFLWVRRVFAGSGSSQVLSSDQCDAIRARIESLYGADDCFAAVRGHINWRSRDDYYRVEIVVSNGCDERARTLCREICELIEREWHVPSSAWAYDAAGRQLASFVE